MAEGTDNADPGLSMARFTVAYSRGLGVATGARPSEGIWEFDATVMHFRGRWLASLTMRSITLTRSEVSFIGLHLGRGGRCQFRPYDVDERWIGRSPWSTRGIRCAPESWSCQAAKQALVDRGWQVRDV